MWNRKDLEEREVHALSRLGIRARDSAGRRVPEQPDPLRTCFQRDRDRVLHSSAFRRLQQKTQVMPATIGDHYRTRLTHSLEVSQLARSACNALGLNADLAETVALAHDLGHPPFGHAGERALHTRMKNHGGFRHNAQGLRIVDILDQSYADRPGLNLCHETRICLLKSKIPDGFPIAEDLPRKAAIFLEGQIVDLCDRVAYVCHDMDDAIRSGLVPWETFSDLELPQRALEETKRRYPSLEHAGTPGTSRVLRSQTVSGMISTLVRDIVHATGAEIETAHTMQTPEDARAAPPARHSPAMREELAELLRRLRERFYRHDVVLQTIGEAADRMTSLFEHLIRDPNKMSERFRNRIDTDGLERAVCDYVSGMTDRYVDKLTRGSGHGPT